MSIEFYFRWRARFGGTQRLHGFLAHVCASRSIRLRLARVFISVVVSVLRRIHPRPICCASLVYASNRRLGLAQRSLPSRTAGSRFAAHSIRDCSIAARAASCPSHNSCSAQCEPLTLNLNRVAVAAVCRCARPYSATPRIGGCPRCYGLFSVPAGYRSRRLCLHESGAHCVGAFEFHERAVSARASCRLSLSTPSSYVPQHSRAVVPQ